MTRPNNAPFAVYSQLMSGSPDVVEQKVRARRMGYEINGNRLISDDGTTYLYDPESITAQLAKEGRNVARLGVGFVGGLAGTPGGPATAMVGSATGAMIGGNTYDAAMDVMAPGGGTNLNEEIGQLRQDAGEELIGAGMGRTVDMAMPLAQKGAGWLVKKVSEAKTTLERMTTERPASEILNPRDEIHDLLDSIRRGDVGIADVDPDIDIVRAAEDMGLVLPADMFSNNARFIEVVSALKSRQGSALRQSEVDALEGLYKYVDETMDMAGNSDVSGVSDHLLTMWSTAERKISDAAADWYLKINPPKKFKFEKLSIRDALRQEANDGPLIGIWPKIQRMLGDEPVTYAQINKVRQEIGKGYQSQGVFKDASDHQLDKAYAAISKDQERVARMFGFDKELAIAHKLTQSYKDIQKRLVGVFGKDLTKDLASTLEPAVSGLVKGRQGKFRELMKKVPAKHRKDVAGSAVQYYLTGGKSHITQSFLERYEKLQRNATAKNELYQYLDPVVTDRIENIYTVSKGIYRSLARTNNSKTARDMIHHMELENGWVSKMNRAGLSLAGNMIKPGAGTVLGMFSSAPKSFSQQADNLLANKRFQELAAAQGTKEATRLEKIVSNTKSFRDWLKSQPAEVQSVVAAQGISRYLWGSSEPD